MTNAMKWKNWFLYYLQLLFSSLTLPLGSRFASGDNVGLKVGLNVGDKAAHKFDMRSSISCVSVAWSH